MEDQRLIWMKGRNEDGEVIDPSKVVTQAPPGSSWHNFGLAVDSAFVGNDPYWELLRKSDPIEADNRWIDFGRVCRIHGLEWGGDFPNFDGPHVQMRFGLSLKDVQALYKIGGIESVFYKVDQIIKGDSNG